MIAGCLAGVALACAGVPDLADMPAQGPASQELKVALPTLAQAAGRNADRSWLVGARPSTVADRLALTHAAKRLTSRPRVYRVSASHTRALTRALRTRDLLLFSERDVIASTTAFPSDPLTPQQNWLQQTRATLEAPPPVTNDSPALAIIESGFDVGHPEFAGTSGLRTTANPVPPDAHGTSVAAIAGAPANGTGVVGMWPGMNVLLSPPRSDWCGDAARAVESAIVPGVAAINMSYGFRGPGCLAHSLAVARAVGAGIVPIAAAGNDFQRGNPLSAPAVDPHVVTVAALGGDLESAPFSNENPAIDVSAPGTGILTAVPISVDGDGVRDGFSAVSGTSFSAPMVAATVPWISQVRPDLSGGQLADVIRASAADLGVRGWDRRFGHGLLDVGAALRARRPPYDPFEPNELFGFVSGAIFGRADSPLAGPRRRLGRLRATVDEFEDPLDIYRVVLPGRSGVVIRVVPTFGDADLRLFQRGAPSPYSRRGLVDQSLRLGRRTDSVFAVNSARGRRSGFIVVNSAGRNTYNAAYRITARIMR